MVQAIGVDSESAFSYINDKGEPIAPPNKYAYEGALETPTVYLNDGVASWGVSGAI
jgi:hypothetical protein